MNIEKKCNVWKPQGNSACYLNDVETILMTKVRNVISQIRGASKKYAHG